MIRSVLGLFLVFSFASAFAASSSSPLEYFYQTPEGQQQFTPSLTYRMAQLKYSVNSAKTEMNGFNLNLMYEYGLNEMLSLGAKAVYGTISSKTTGNGTPSASDKNTGSGLGDLDVFLRGHINLQEGRFFWFGADLMVSPGNSETKEKTDKTESNMYSGGHKLKPYIGYSMLLTETLTFGAKLRTEINLTDATAKETDTAGTVTTTKNNGGQETGLSLFLETPLAQGAFGGSIEYAGAATSTEKNTATGNTKRSANVNNLSLGIYGTHAMSETAILRGDLNYHTIVSDVTGLSSSTFIEANIAARFTF